MRLKSWRATIIFDLWGVLINYPRPYPTDHKPNVSHITLHDGANLAKECAQAGHRLFILSNCSNRTKQIIKTDFPDLYNLFEQFLTSEEIGYKKPDPAYFTYLLNAYQLTPGTSFFLDDSPANVASAKGVGITGIDYTNYASAKKALEILGVL